MRLTATAIRFSISSSESPSAWSLSIVGTLILLKFVDMVIGLRVTREEEIEGLDVTQHGEEGYDFGS